MSVDALLSPGLGFHRGCGTVPLPLSAQGGDRDGDLSWRGGPDTAGLPGLAGCAACAHGHPCHLTFPLGKLGGHKWGHWPRWERGVQHGGECRCHREGVSEPSRAPAWGWTEHADTKDASTHAGSHRETSPGHRATSPRHPGKGRLAGMGRTTRAARGGEGTGFSLQTEASIPKQIPLVYCKCCGKATGPRGCGRSNPTVGRLPRGLHAGWGQGGGEMPGHPIWKARWRTWRRWHPHLAVLCPWGADPSQRYAQYTGTVLQRMLMVVPRMERSARGMALSPASFISACR